MKNQLLITLAMAAWLAGCGSAGDEQVGPAASTATAPVEHGVGIADHDTGQMTEACPMQLEGAAVTSAEIEGGVALDFTTTGDGPELGKRVRRMAEMHNMGQGMTVPAATASVEDIDGGARLVFQPEDSAQLGALREHVRAGRMGLGECTEMYPGPGMMGQGMGAMPHRMRPPARAAGE